MHSLEQTGKQELTNAMQTNLTSLIKLTAFALMVAAAAVQVQAADKKADPTGTWKWSVPGRNGGPARDNTMTLKRDGDKLTGKVKGGRAGDEGTDIEEGKIKGDEISFKVTREFNGNKIVAKYKGTLSEDTIKGKAEIDRGTGDPVSRDWEAKREDDKK
jgi:hypothetical protein